MPHEMAFETLDNLMKYLKTEEISASKHRLKYIRKAVPVVIDEVGFLPLSPSEARLFFGFVSSMAEKTSLFSKADKTEQTDLFIFFVWFIWSSCC